MDKISISDFCGEEKTYAQLIQDLYFHISVKELYMVLASNAAQNRDVYESVSYENASGSYRHFFNSFIILCLIAFRKGQTRRNA